MTDPTVKSGDTETGGKAEKAADKKQSPFGRGAIAKNIGTDIRVVVIDGRMLPIPVPVGTLETEAASSGQSSIQLFEQILNSGFSLVGSMSFQVNL